MRRIGAHVPTTNPVAEAEARSADVIQVFCSNPRGWRHPAATHRLARDLKPHVESGELSVYVHAPYLVNFCSAAEEVREKSVALIEATLISAASLGASGVVVHGGQAGEAAAEDTTTRYKQWKQAWKQLAPTLIDTEVPLLVENTAGGPVAAARTPQGLAQIVASGQATLKKASHLVGVCLDTAHAWAAGWTIRGVQAAGPVKLIHANGSATAHNSRVDEHTNFRPGDNAKPNRLGDFYIYGVFEAWPRLDVIVETPGGAEQQGADIAWLRDLQRKVDAGDRFYRHPDPAAPYNPDLEAA